MQSLKKWISLKLAGTGKNAKTPTPSVIGFDTKIKGDIWGGETVHIDGRIEGNIMCDNVIIGARGYILGDIKAKSLRVFGTINGTIDTDDLFVAGSARLIGNTCYNRISLEPGAYVEGNCIPRSKASVIKSAANSEAEIKHDTEIKAVQ